MKARKLKDGACHLTQKSLFELLVEKIQAIILYMFFSYIADSLYRRKAVNSRKSISRQLIQRPFVLCFQICVMQRRLKNVAGCITIRNTCCVLFQTEITRNSV